VFFFAAVSDSFIPFALGDQWIPAAKFVKIISISAFLFPINTYNISISKVIGKPHIFANAIFFQKILTVPVVIIGIFTNIETLIWGTAITAFFSFYYNSFKVRQMLNVTLREQFLSVYSVVAIPLFCAIVMYIIWMLLPAIGLGYILLVQLITGIGLFIMLCELKKQDEYLELKTILVTEYNKMRKK
jgi:O-antigen/teichoic acid export membrane protein